MGIQKIITFNGVEYRLMGTGRYYLSQSNTNRGRKNPKGLHTAIWEFYSGKKVPKGYCVHHKDGDVFNNEYSNLECISIREHMQYHSRKNYENPEYRQKNRIALSHAQEAAKEWHKSEEGRAWHREHASSIDWTPKYECICIQCGKYFKSCHKGAKFCCDECGEKYRATDLRYTAVCKQCGKEFRYGKRKPSSPDRQFCCKSCRAIYTNIHRAKKGL